MKLNLLILPLLFLISSTSMAGQEKTGKECDLILFEEEGPLKKVFYTTQMDEVNNYLILEVFSIVPESPENISYGVEVEGEEFGFPPIPLATQGDEVFSATTFLSVTDNGLLYLDIALDNKANELRARKRLTERPALDSGFLERRSNWFSIVNCAEATKEIQ